VIKRTNLKRAFYIFVGMLALVLAYIGIIVPGFPGIPFVVLAAYFFANSSPRLYAWMMRQPLMKRLLKKSKKIDPRIFKGLLISQVWFSVAVAVFTIAHQVKAKIIWVSAGIVLTILILILMKTHRKLHPPDDGDFHP
jgi:uncharacterized membrane protein YbaN (DUF454 family)